MQTINNKPPTQLDLISSSPLEMNTNLGPIINTIACLTMAFETSTLSTELMDVNIFKISFEPKKKKRICDCVVMNQSIWKPIHRKNIQ